MFFLYKAVHFLCLYCC